MDGINTITTLNVLLVENHNETAKYLRIYLIQQGHEVTVASDLQSALAFLSNVRVNFILSDINLPDGNGWTLLEEAKTDPQIFAVAMSGFGSDLDKERSRVAGFRYHLVKPFLPEELDILLRKAVSEQ